VEWPLELSLYYSWCHQCHQNAFISIFPLSSGTEKRHCIPLFPSLTRNLMFVRCSNSSSLILAAAHQNTQTVIAATQKETAIDQQQHSCETLICQRHQTILRCLSSTATASTQWRRRPTTYACSMSRLYWYYRKVARNVWHTVDARGVWGHKCNCGLVRGPRMCKSP